MIARETIDEILMRTDIESLIGGYTSLRRAGSNLKGLCPFHSEKTPSFTVYPSDNSFYCFGCGVGGNAITFTQRIEHLDYPDAIEFLAKRAGITVIRDDKDFTPREKTFDKTRILKMNVDAAKYFHACLFRNTEESKAALAYLTEKRALSVSTIKHFGLGFAPDSFTDFSNYMRSRGYTYDELVAGFLCGKSDKGTYYDAFRNRVMFPIIDVSGNVIAFGGRVMDDSKPKYKNSSDTPVYKKSRHLFALNFARHNCSETMILCEGYMDVIAMHAAGFTNAVATLGTAITSEQARVMSRYTKKVVISYDSDEAGQKATERALKIISDVGLDVSILKVPGSKDPDEYIKTFGRDKFLEVLNESKTPFEYNMDAVLSKYDINIPQDKIKALKELENIISAVYSTAEREIYIDIISKKMSVQPLSVKTDVDKIISRRISEYKKNESAKIKQNMLGYSDRVNPDYIKAPAVAKNEENVLGLMLLYPEHRKRIFEENLLSEGDFFTDLNRRVFKFVKERSDASWASLPDFNEAFNTDEVGRITKMKISRMALVENGEVVLDESIASLKKSVQKKNSAVTNTLEGLDNLLKSKRNN